MTTIVIHDEAIGEAVFDAIEFLEEATKIADKLQLAEFDKERSIIEIAKIIGDRYSAIVSFAQREQQSER